MTDAAVNPGQDTEPHLADQVAEATTSVTGVGALHAGSFGEVGTYLPGRRVAGIRIGADVTEVHIAVEMGSAIREVADAVVAVVAPLVDTPVQVVVEDVVDPRLGA